MHAASAVPAAVPRRLAANLLEAQLLRLARAGAVVERRLGPGLLALCARRLYRRLGFVRLGDYLTERLGMSLRRCQSIVRLERALRDLPAVAAAFDAGALPPSKVRVVASAATPETQDLWLARAKQMTVRDLEAAARASRQAERSEVTKPASREVGSEVALEEPGAAAPDAAKDLAPEQGVTAAPLSPEEGAAPAPRPPEDEPGVLISFAAPGRAFAVWHWALEFVRRVAGRQEPAWRCAEYLAAEFLSGCPDTGDHSAQAAGDAGPAVGDPSPASIPVRPPPRCTIPDAEVWARAVAAVRDALRSLGSAADVETILLGPPPAALSGPASAAPSAPPLGLTAPPFITPSAPSLTPSAPPLGVPEAPPESTRASAPSSLSEASEPDPWSLDGSLRGFVRLRQSLAWRQGRLLATVATLNLYRELGYDSLGDWCQCVLGMSPRRARYLVSLDRRLDRLPLVADAYRRGLVSWCQARLLVRVALPGTESRWVRYARRVTVRRLEDVVTASAVALADPALGSEIRTSPSGAPLPPSEPLPPCEPQGRHTFAPQDVADSPALPLDPAYSARHTFAPPHGSSPIAGDGALRPARHTFAPEPAMHRIAFWAPLDVAAVWRSAIRACRRARGPHLRDWECLLIFIIEMRDAWQPHENAEWRRRYHILDRDGWRCLAPGCTSRSHLNAHHMIFRSHCRGDDESNLVTLCVGHHQAGVHDNLIRCYGRAPDAIWWEFGIRPDGPPLVRYFGDRIVGGAASAGALPAEIHPGIGTSPGSGPSARPRAEAAPARIVKARRGDPPSWPPDGGESHPWNGSGSCRPLAELRQVGADSRTPGL